MYAESYVLTSRGESSSVCGRVPTRESRTPREAEVAVKPSCCKILRPVNKDSSVRRLLISVKVYAFALFPSVKKVFVLAVAPSLVFLLSIPLGFHLFGKSFRYGDHPVVFAVVAAMSSAVLALTDSVERRHYNEKVKTRRKLTEQLRSNAEKSLLLVQGQRPTAYESHVAELLELITKTSTASARTSTVMSTHEGLQELRSQFDQLAQQVEEHKNEIVEVQKIDPVLEATLKVGLENLTKRIEALEKKQLEKWDVALVTFQVLSGIGVIVGVLFAILKYMSGK
jgi:hypothetical protein